MDFIAKLHIVGYIAFLVFVLVTMSGLLQPMINLSLQLIKALTML